MGENHSFRIVDGVELRRRGDDDRLDIFPARQNHGPSLSSSQNAAASTDPILPYHARIEELASKLATTGSLGLVVLDFSSLEPIEYEYGADVYERVRKRILELMVDLSGRSYRSGDVPALDEPGGLRLLIFLKEKREGSSPLTASDPRILKERLLAAVRPKIARIGFPYLANPLRIEVGHSVALNNPLLNPKRVLDRAFHQAVERAVHQRRADDFSLLESLQETISGKRVVTVYQSIVRIKDRKVLGFEALTRGAIGTGMETADVLFGAARDHQLLVELDRLCRTKALESARRIPRHAKIFINTLPATIRDPEFRGKPLIEFLDRAGISPDRIVIEITEKLVIENYNLFAETLAYFTELGMRFAVDDVGAGYSGLEAVARLRPAYLKIDIGLVRELHASQTNQEMIKAILAMGRGIEATVVAEGIQTESEAQTLESLGVEYGQGFYFSRPLPVSECEE